MGDRIAELGMSLCPLCFSLLLSHCELESKDALVWSGLCCSMEAQDGEEAEEEEDERGRFRGEAGSSFSIMAVMSPSGTELLFLSTVCVSPCLVPVLFLYVCKDT